MQYRTLGSSKNTVSVISLGTLQVQNSDSEKNELLKLFSYAIDMGINFVDTSANYRNGIAEKFVGQVLKQNKSKSIAVATKVFFPIEGIPEIGGLGKTSIHASVDYSLANLGIETIDLVQCHRWDPKVPILETAQTFTALRKMGKIQHWGLGAATVSQIVETFEVCRKNNLDFPISHQHVYNMFNRTIESDILNVSDIFDLNTLVYSPLAQGVLTGKYTLTEIPVGSRAADPTLRSTMWEFAEVQLKKVEELNKLAKHNEMDLASLSLAWCLRNKNVSSLICGIKTKEQLQQNLKALTINLTAELNSNIEKILLNSPKNQYLN